MKKLYLSIALICAAACLFSGCANKCDYLNYISEERYDIYLYQNDGLEIKIYNSVKETPFCADGVKGETGELCEIFITLPQNYDTVAVSVGEIEGEMSYQSVDNLYYLSCSGAVAGESAQVTLTCGGNSATYDAVSVRYDGVLSCGEAVKCVIERESEMFAEMTQNNVFCGEIFVRLLYDEGCYYYVGVCDRNKKISAYLVDGERGKIIAAKEMQG